METKTVENQSVLLTDEGDGKMKAVAGLNQDGRLKTVDPKQANEPDFMKLDKNSNILESFLTNYFAQAKNPRHTGFYQVAKDGIEEIASVISGLLKSGGKEGEEFLKEYKVDTSKYERQDVDMSRGAEENVKPTEQKQEYKPLDIEKIDWEAFAKIGITRESLEKSGSLDDMLNYRRSSNLHPITIKVEDLTVNTDARLSLRTAEDGRIIPVIHAVRRSPELDRPFYGNILTAEDKTNLRKTGHLGRTIDMNIKGVDKPVQAYVSIDPKTNELVAYSTKNVRIPKEIKGVALNDNQRQDLKEGRAVYLEGMKAKSGKMFDAYVQISGSERGIVFSFDELRKKQAQEQKQEGVRIPTKLGGVDLSKDQRSELQSGGVIYVENLLDKQGKTYNAYIKVNEERGKLDFYRWDPRQKQEVSPNNEATKSVKEPLAQDQVEPQNEQQRQSRGRRM